MDNALGCVTPSNVFNTIGLSEIGHIVGENQVLLVYLQLLESQHCQYVPLDLPNHQIPKLEMLFLMIFFNVATFQSKLKVEVPNVG